MSLRKPDLDRSQKWFTDKPLIQHHVRPCTGKKVHAAVYNAVVLVTRRIQFFHLIIVKRQLKAAVVGVLVVIRHIRRCLCLLIDQSD